MSLTELFSARESSVTAISAGDGKIANLLLQCTLCQCAAIFFKIFRLPGRREKFKNNENHQRTFKKNRLLFQQKYSSRDTFPLNACPRPISHTVWGGLWKKKLQF